MSQEILCKLRRACLDEKLPASFVPLLYEAANKIQELEQDNEGLYELVNSLECEIAVLTGD